MRGTEHESATGSGRRRGCPSQGRVGAWRAALGVAALVLASPALSQDVLSVASMSGTAGSTVQVPIHIRDVAGTPLGIDAGTGNRIQGLAVSIAFAPAAAVTSATIVRSGITAALTPLFETTGSTTGVVSYLGSCSETAAVLPFSQPPSATGDEVLRLRLTLASTASGTITLTPQPAGTVLSNQAGTVSETVGDGNLSLQGGVITLGTVTAANIVATGGTPQSAPISSAFALPLQVTVTDAAGNPFAGAAVTFSAPSSGASASLSNGGSATTDANGHASVTATANGVAGGPYLISATTGTLPAVTFSLTNLQGAANAIPMLGGLGLLGLALLVLAAGAVVLTRAMTAGQP